MAPSLKTHEIFSLVSNTLSNTSAHHVLLRDFNIHHPNWGGPRVRPYCASQLILSLQDLHHLSLLLPPKTITFKKHGGESTIDLAFSSTNLIHTLTTCRLRQDLYHGSDHYPIETAFFFSPHVFPHTSKPLWKKADKVGLSFKAWELEQLPRTFINCEDVDAEVDRLVR
jgi:hypothetical protein